MYSKICQDVQNIITDFAREHTEQEIEDLLLSKAEEMVVEEFPKSWQLHLASKWFKDGDNFFIHKICCKWDEMCYVESESESEEEWFEHWDSEVS